MLQSRHHRCGLTLDSLQCVRVCHSLGSPELDTGVASPLLSRDALYLCCVCPVCLNLSLGPNSDPLPPRLSLPRSRLSLCSQESEVPGADLISEDGEEAIEYLCYFFILCHQGQDPDTLSCGPLLFRAFPLLLMCFLLDLARQESQRPLGTLCNQMLSLYSSWVIQPCFHLL